MPKITLEIPDGMRIGQAIWNAMAGKFSPDKLPDIEIAENLFYIPDAELQALLSKAK